MEFHKVHHTIEFRAIVYLTKDPLWPVRRPGKLFCVLEEQQSMWRGNSQRSRSSPSYTAGRLGKSRQQACLQHSKMYSSNWQGPAASPWSTTTKQQGLQHIPLFRLLWASFFLPTPSRGSFSHPHTLQNFCPLSSFLSFCSFLKTASLQVFQSFAEASQRHKAVLLDRNSSCFKSVAKSETDVCGCSQGTGSKVTGCDLLVFGARLIGLCHVTCDSKAK